MVCAQGNKVFESLQSLIGSTALCTYKLVSFNLTWNNLAYAINAATCNLLHTKSRRNLNDSTHMV